MRRLRARSGDEGAVAAILVVMVAVLVAVAALVVDVGGLYVERRQLQNGADGAALAVAAACASQPSSCTQGMAESTAQDLADLNANDLHADAAVTLGTGTVSVTTTTDTGPTATPGSNTKIPGKFINVVLPTYDGTTVKASATAVWGGIGAASTLPLTMSMCDFNMATSGDVNSGNTMNLPSASYTTYFHTQTQSSANVCPNPAPAGQTVPGGWGWLDSATGTCSAVVTADGWVGGDVAPNPPPTNGSNATTCESYLQSLATSGQSVLMPVFGRPDPCTFTDTTWCDGVRGSGGGGEYYIVGFAAFIIEGYKLKIGNGGEYSYNPPCTDSNDTCIRGKFVALYAPNAVPAFGGTTNYGATTVGLSG